MRRDHLDALGDAESRQAGIDDEGGDATASFALAGAGEHDVKIGDAAVGDPGLLAVEHIGVAVFARGAAERCHVRSGVRLGKGERRDRLAGRGTRQIGAFLLLGAVEGDRARAQALHGEGEISEAGMARQRLADKADRARVDHVGNAAIGSAADRVARPAGGAELADQRATGSVHVALVVVSNVGSGPGVELALELAVPFLEERPVEIAFVAHGDRKGGRDAIRTKNARPASPLPPSIFSCLRSAASASPRRHDRRGGSPASSCRPPAPAPRRRSLHPRPSPIPGAASAW